MSSSLDALKASGTTIVLDSADFESTGIAEAQDATTNPSLILAASKLSSYRTLIDVAVASSRTQEGSIDKQVEHMLDQLLVSSGVAILKRIPGRVSTEVDARLSFDEAGTISKARQLIKLYEDAGIHRGRILIKIAATWEGIHAAEKLEREDIHCNMTLLFGFAQAVACAEAEVTLVSPYVGRILDWFTAHTKEQYSADSDPGVQFVGRVFRYYKQHGYKTAVMGASFRNMEEIHALAGCDYLTIAPTLLEELKNSCEQFPKQLATPSASQMGEEKLSYLHHQTAFRLALFDDEVAFEKLHDGIRAFHRDTLACMAMLRERIKT